MNATKLYFLSLRNSRGCATAAKGMSCLRRSATGLLLGVYSKGDGRHDTAQLTKSANKYNAVTKGRLWELLRSAGPCPVLGETRIFYELDPDYSSVGVVGLGDSAAECDVIEGIDKRKENIRIAAGAGVRALESLELHKLYVEGFGHAESSAEGAGLGAWKHELSKSKLKPPPTFELYDDSDWTGWSMGLEKAAAQNLARRFAAAPSNVLTPIAFAKTSVDVLCKTGINVEVMVKDWAEIQGLGGFLAVAKGSSQQPIFMELSYYGTGDLNQPPIVLVGKGCTFDSGGIMRKDMHHMWGDKSGAACVVAAIRAAATLQLQLNIRGLIPLAENMPGSGAMKPGDIVRMFNGKNVLIQDTRCEGRLMMADALAYAKTYQPKCIVDVGTLTKGAWQGLSTAASGVFTTSEDLWKTLSVSSIHTGDRLWRLPLFRHYTHKVIKSRRVDLKTTGRRNSLSGRSKHNSREHVDWSGEPCRAAAFLREFTPTEEWIHIDNFGVMVTDGETDSPYLRAGMTGRPTRTLIEFLYQMHTANQSE